MTEQIRAAFELAVRAILAQNDALVATLETLAPAYRGQTPLPPRPQRLSRLLDCEANGAHRLLENFASACKRIPRGAFPPPLLDELLASCDDLVAALAELLEASADCQTAAYPVQQTEARLVNFLKGISGAGADLPQEKYEERIDKMIRDLKATFTEFGRCLVRHEHALAHPAPPPVAATRADVAEVVAGAAADVKKIVRKAKRDIIVDAHTERQSEADRRRPKGVRWEQVKAVREDMRRDAARGIEPSAFRSSQRVWADLKGGYPSAISLYRYCHNHESELT